MRLSLSSRYLLKIFFMIGMASTIVMPQVYGGEIGAEALAGAFNESAASAFTTGMKLGLESNIAAPVITQTMEDAMRQGLSEETIASALEQTRREIGTRHYNTAMVEVGRDIGKLFDEGIPVDQIASQVKDIIAKRLHEEGASFFIDNLRKAPSFSFATADLQAFENLQKLSGTVVVPGGPSAPAIELSTPADKAALAAGYGLTRADTLLNAARLSEDASAIEAAEAASKTAQEAYEKALSEVPEGHQQAITKQRLTDQYNAALKELADAKEELKTSPNYKARALQERVKIAENQLKFSEAAIDKAADIFPAKGISAAERLQGILQWTKGRLIGIAESLLGAAIFMVPSFLQSGINSREQRQALYTTIAAPQYIGNCWMQIPKELINANNPNSSIFLYVALDNVTPDEARRMRQGERVREFAQAQYATADYFITSGEMGLAQYPITLNAAGQMLHLNSGFEFYSDGAPINTAAPARQLLGSVPGQDPRTITVIQFLQSMAGKVQSGTPLMESYDMFANGGQPEVQRAPGSGTIAAQLMPPDPLDLNKPPHLFARALSALTNPHTFASGIQVQGIKGLTNSELQTLMGQAGAAQASAPDLVYGAYNLFIYQTPSTALARNVRASLTGAARDLAYDYVVGVDRYYSYIPALVPHSDPDNGQETTHIPHYGINNEVAYLFSLLDGTFTEVSTGNTSTTVPAGTADALIKSVVFPPIAAPLLNQITAVKNFMIQRQAQGPFHIGTYVLTVLPELAGIQDLFMYSCKTDVNGDDGTLEGSAKGAYVDYLVPLDNNQNPVQLPAPGLVKFFASLVSSRIYTKDLTLATDPVSFQLVQVIDPYPPNQNTLMAYPLSTTSVSAWAQSSFWKQSQGAVITPTPRQTRLGTYTMEWEFNPFNGQPPALIFLEQEIETSINTGPTTSFASLRGAGGALPRAFAAAVAYWLGQGLANAGVTDQQLIGKNLQQIAQGCVQVLAAALAQNTGINADAPTPAIIIALNKNPQAWANLGTTLSAALNNDAVAIGNFNNIQNVLGKITLPPSSNLSVRLAYQDKIPNDKLFVFNPQNFLLNRGSSGLRVLKQLLTI